MKALIGAAAPLRGQARQPLVIRNHDQLDALAAELASNLHRRHAGFDLDLPDMEPLERQRWQRRLESGYFACGCATATAAGLAALAGYLIYRLAATGGPASLHWLDAVGALLAFIIGTGLGKALGTHRARLRLLNTIDELRQRVPAGTTRPAPQPTARCGLGVDTHADGGMP